MCGLTDLTVVQAKGARLLLIFGAGAAGGIGLTSCLFFVCTVFLQRPRVSMVVELGALIGAAFLVYRRRTTVVPPAQEVRSALVLPIALSLLLALGVGTVAVTAAWDANPNGDWDAWAIWNLRARFLASDAGLAQRAWSPSLAATSHPAYPLLVSSFVGRDWAFSHSFSPTVPAATSYLFLLALIALAAGGVMAIRGPTFGLLAGLVLAASPSLLHEVPSQYADIPLACYFTGAIVFGLLDRPVLAGIFAGFAAWTKDEGLLFLIVALAAILVFRRRAVLAAIAGAAPIAVLVAYFKMALSSTAAPQLATNLTAATHQAADAGRYGTIAAAFAREFAGMGSGWYHPILPLIVLALALRFDREHWRDVAFCGAIAVALLLGFFGVYILTTNDLNWILQTSLTRILVQVWPALVLTGMLALRTPEATASQNQETPAKIRRKVKR